MNISLAPEPVFHLGHFAITNSILTAWCITVLMLVGAFFVRRSLSKVPGKIQNVLEMIYSWLFDTTTKIVGRADVTAEILPLVLTFFFFIVFSNWSGLLPGFNSIGVHELHEGEDILIPLFRAPTSDLNTVVVLALFAVGYVQYLGIKYAGFSGYMKRFFDFSNPIAWFVGTLELIGEFTRIISFSFRLFGNVFAGEVLIMVMFYLTIKLLPFVAIIPLPFFLLELFVGVVQAFIFCFLTIIFVSLAVVAHDSGGHKHNGEDLELASLAD